MSKYSHIGGKGFKIYILRAYSSIHDRVDLGFVGPEAYIILWHSLKKYKIMNIKLPGPLPRSWKGLEA